MKLLPYLPILWVLAHCPHLAAMTIDQVVAYSQRPGRFSVEKFLASLPASMQEFALLVPFSGGLGYASPLEPRIIIASESADMIMAFNGSCEESNSRSNIIELIHFDYETSEWRFGEVVFDPTASRPPKYISDPPTCITCHQGTPNWGSYNLWLDTYGVESHFRPNEESLDHNLLDTFLSSTSSSTRFQLIDPLRAELVNTKATQLYFYLVRRNAEFHDALTKLNYRRIANKILRSAGGQDLANLLIKLFESRSDGSVGLGGEFQISAEELHARREQVEGEIRMYRQLATERMEKTFLKGRSQSIVQKVTGQLHPAVIEAKEYNLRFVIPVLILAERVGQLSTKDWSFAHVVMRPGEIRKGFPLLSGVSFNFQDLRLTLEEAVRRGDP